MEPGLTGPDTPDSKAPDDRSSELLLRFGSAAILIPIGLASIWFGGWLLAVFAAAAAAAMAFEFTRMIGSPLTWLAVVITVLSCIAFQFDRLVAAAILGGGGAVAAALVVKPPLRFSYFFGILYAGGLSLGVLSLRGHPVIGFEAAMCVMLCTWASDTAAFFVGKALGGPKLAPVDSPNKTWSGAIGGVVFASLSGWAFGGLISASDLLSWALVGGAVSISAQLGDLFESQVKRRYGVKDVSGILPGHGGVMDRVDGFGTAALIAVCALAFVPGLVDRLGG